MSQHPSNSDWLEQALESTRRDVRQLEIDACRIRTNLVRIEVANSAGVSNGEATALLCAPDSEVAQPALLDGEPRLPIATADSPEWQPAALPASQGMDILIDAPPHAHPESQLIDSPPIEAESLSVAELANRLRVTNRSAASPVMTSLVVHAAILLLTFSITVATIEHTEQPFSATFLDLPSDPPAEPPKQLESIDDHQLRDLGETVARDLGSNVKPSDVVGVLNQDPIPLDFQSPDGPMSLGAVGPLDPLVTDMGTLLTGGGGLDGKGAPAGLGNGNLRGRGGGVGPIGGKAAGRLETTLFFGTQAKGDRFVFVVDNSSSMKGGRLEMAVGELNRTIASLSPKQSFYVIFVSDQTYPMFMLNPPI